jgi:hypothetical protein
MMPCISYCVLLAVLMTFNYRLQLCMIVVMVLVA